MKNNKKIEKHLPGKDDSMILIAAVDDRNGMTFNHRRQSQDRIMREKMVNLCGGRKIWMNSYSAKLFPDDVTEVSENCLEEAMEGEFCFVENMPAAPYEGKMERIILFKWNRSYPADSYFDIELSGWELAESEDFTGSSHDKITMVTYRRKQ